MTLRMMRIAGLLLAWFLFTGGSHVSAAELLRWQWRPGAQWESELKQTIDQETTVGQRVVTLSGTQRIVMQYTVDEVASDGVAKVLLMVTRLQLNLDLGNLGKIEFDSDLDKEPAGLTTALAGPFRALVGAKITQRMAADGKVLEFELPDDVRQSIESNPLARQMFFQGIMSELAGKASLPLPEGQVEMGQEWKSEGKISTELGDTPVTTIYRYRGKAAKATGNLDIIDVRVELGAFPPEVVAQTPIKLVEQNGQGTVWFDNQLGRLSSAHFEQLQTIEIGKDDQQITQKLRKTTDVNIKLPTAEALPTEAPATTPPPAVPPTE